MRVPAAAAVVLAAALIAPVPAAAAKAAPAVEFFRMEDLRPGMVGVGRTVFSGLEMEDFKVEIIGVLENVGPRQSIILARLEGGPLAKTGVIAGMSGSPVYIDGKLLGAVAYGFPFAKETIGGITPIGEMVEAASLRTPRAPSTKFAMQPGQPIGPETFLAALQRPAGGAAPAILRGGGLPDGVSAQTMTPIGVPLSFSGIEPAAFEWAKGAFGSLGFVPVMSGARGTMPAGPLPDLAPGSPVGISLIEGDMDLSATGTVTHIDGNRVYAFGHPFYNLGPTQFPMKKAYVYSVFPSLYQSWKISTSGETVGTLDQDRTVAVAGMLGAAPRMIPVSVRLRTSKGVERSYSYRIVDDEMFSPVLSYTAVMSSLMNSERAFGTASFGVEARVSVTDASGRSRQVSVGDIFSQDLPQAQPAMSAAALVATPVAFLMSNNSQRVRVDRIEVDVDAQEAVQTATLQRAWLERAGPVRPGETVPLRLLFRTFRGETRSETVGVQIPESARTGPYTLLVADGPTMSTVEMREARLTTTPRDLDQLVKTLNGLRKRNRVYVRLTRPEAGAVIAGETLESLPPSVLAVLGGPEAAVPLRAAAVWEAEVPVGLSVSGTRVLTVNVQR